MNVIDNTERKRYETKQDGNTAYIDYIRTLDKVYLTHTEVPSQLEGQGIGSKLVKNVLEKIKQEDKKIVPLCPFVAAYIKENPEWKEMLASGYSIK